MLEDIAKLLVNTTPIDYFDFKSLMAVNKTLYEVIAAETQHIDQGIHTRLYANIFGFFANVFPGKLKRNDNAMGVRILFRGPKSYTNIPDLEEKFVIGMGQVYGEDAKYYFGNDEAYNCVTKSYVNTMREVIHDLIRSNMTQVRQIDISYCNIEEKSYYDFVSQFLQIVTNGPPILSVSLTRVAFIPENMLLFH